MAHHLDRGRSTGGAGRHRTCLYRTIIKTQKALFTASPKPRQTYPPMSMLAYAGPDRSLGWETPMAMSRMLAAMRTGQTQNRPMGHHLDKGGFARGAVASACEGLIEREVIFPSVLVSRWALPSTSKTLGQLSGNEGIHMKGIWGIPFGLTSAADGAGWHEGVMFAKIPKAFSSRILGWDLQGLSSAGCDQYRSRT